MRPRTATLLISVAGAVGVCQLSLWEPLHEPTELPRGEARLGVQNDALAPTSVDANAATDSALRASAK